MGITGCRESADEYDDDMQRAKESGIDAFALNIGTDSYNDTQLGYAYTSAARNEMKVFLSFDFNWWGLREASEVGAMIREYANHPAQLRVDDKVFVSSFMGDGCEIEAIISAAGQEIFFAPNFHPNEGNFDFVQAAFNWMAWPSNGENKAPTRTQNVTVSDGDLAYANALSGKPYIARKLETDLNIGKAKPDLFFLAVSPWFFTHYGTEVSYSKNWVFPSDLLWYTRWQEILQLKPRFVEIITWNDYGESHYIGPLSSPHNDDGNSKWTLDM